MSATLTAPRQLMLDGLERSSQAHKDSLNAAKLVAQLIGAQQDTVTCDDVFKWISPVAVGASAGAIFRNGPWEFSHWQESKRESNHARPIRAWRLSGGR